MKQEKFNKSLKFTSFKMGLFNFFGGKKAQLICWVGNEKYVFDLFEKEIVIGRGETIKKLVEKISEKITINITNRSGISREHLVLYWNKKSLSYEGENLGKAGTKINDKWIKPGERAELWNQDIFSIGKLKFQILYVNK